MKLTKIINILIYSMIVIFIRNYILLLLELYLLGNTFFYFLIYYFSNKYSSYLYLVKVHNFNLNTLFIKE